MKCREVVVAGSLVLAAQGVAAEGALDMTQPLVCAATQVVECAAAGECARANPETFNLPVLLKIDLANKVVESARVGGAKRTSAITGMTEAGGVSVLQGVDEADGWSATINQASGRMTVVSAAEGIGYVVFGTCASL